MPSIKITEETTRFFTGDTVEYVKATPEWLANKARTLGVTERERRSFAAAGLVRAALDVPIQDRGKAHEEALSWAMNLLWRTRGRHTLSTLTKKDTLFTMPDFLRGLPPVNAVLDSVSIEATRSNQPEVMAEILNRVVPEGNKSLVIALGHGGIISAADTYRAGAGRVFQPVRFSRYKKKDGEPVLGELETEHLKAVAEVSPVVVLDDDRGFGNGTLETALSSFEKLFGKKIYGATPVTSRHPSIFEPRVVDSDGNELFRESIGNAGEWPQTVGDLFEGYRRTWMRRRN